MSSDDDRQSRLSENVRRHSSDASEIGENGALNFDDEKINGDDDADLFGSGSEEPDQCVSTFCLPYYAK